MKILSKFINYSLQEELVEQVANTKIPHRVRADGSLETAQKWKDAIYDLCVEMMLDLFDRPILFNYGPPTHYDEYILKLAKHNIPFYTLTINGKYTIVTDDSDADYICENIGYSQKQYEKINK
jgi:hypothetical protein